MVVALFVILPFSQDLPGRTGKGVIVSIIDKIFLGENPFLASLTPRGNLQRIKMSLYLEIMASQIIFSGPVLAICHNDFSFSASIFMMTVE